LFAARQARLTTGTISFSARWPLDISEGHLVDDLEDRLATLPPGSAPFGLDAVFLELNPAQADGQLVKATCPLHPGCWLYSDDTNDRVRICTKDDHHTVFIADVVWVWNFQVRVCSGTRFVNLRVWMDEPVGKAFLGITAAECALLDLDEVTRISRLQTLYVPLQWLRFTLLCKQSESSSVPDIRIREVFLLDFTPERAIIVKQILDYPLLYDIIKKEETPQDGARMTQHQRSREIVAEAEACLLDNDYDLESLEKKKPSE
jgi:hypothetical protein